MEKLAIIIGIPGNLDAEDDFSNALQDDGLWGDLGAVIERAVRDWVSEYMKIPYRSVEVETKRLVGIVLVE